MRWEKTKDWRPKCRILSGGKDLSINYHEVGKATIKVEYITEVDIKLHMIQDSQENNQNQSQQSSWFGSKFGMLGAGAPKHTEAGQMPQRRNRAYTDEAPQIENRF